MKSSYKKLRQYIEPVNQLNDGMEVEELLGISNNKYFQNSHTNTIGIDLSTYRIVRTGQFAYNRATTRNGDKISIALRQGDDCIVSPSYRIFKSKDENVLNSEYLMMWFRRPEFDRYARFKSHGSAHEFFEWEQMTEVELPIPHIDKQREIVKEYNVIQNRIALNQQLIQKLEETAQAIYREWFVEFEFPDEKGQPYKSNGGQMVVCEIGEIPKNWELKEITSICDITSSKRIFESEYQKRGIPFYRGKEITQKKAGDVISDLIYISIERYNELIKNYGKPSKGDILMTAVGTIGSTYMVEDEQFYFKDGNVIWFKNFKQKGSNYFLYDFMQTEQFSNLINEITIGSTQSAITIKTFGQQKLVFPENKILDKYLNLSSVLNDNLKHKKNENKKLSELKELLLSKLATVEN
ncbi:MAG: restriction endonuclease subunit S [Victivallaceae bacterium]|nr:restriction endonuclease subunit S [Victivallaceae bacterium]